MRRFWGARSIGLVFFLALAPGTATAQTIAISHNALGCWPSNRYPVVTARLNPPEQVRAARVYFRAEQYADFYFVDAAIGVNGRVEAVLPLAADGTQRVVYYIEVMALGFESSRTGEWLPVVSDAEDCRRRDPQLVLFGGDGPGILVRAVRTGAPALPPGFLASGVLGSGGGLSAIAVGGAVAGGAAAGIVIATSGDGESGPGTPEPAAPATTAPTTTTSSVAGGPGATTTTTAPATTTTTGAASTTTTTAATTTTATATTTTVPPTSTTTTTSPRADVAVSIGAPSTIVLGNLLTYDVTVWNNGPSDATGVRLTVSFPSTLTLQSTSSAKCTGFVGSVECNLGTVPVGGSQAIQVRVLALQLGSVTATASVVANEVDPVPGNNSASVTTNVTVLLRELHSTALRVTTYLDVSPRDGRDRGQVVLGGRLFACDSSTPVEVRTHIQPGDQVLEAVLVDASGRGGRWRFDFGDAPLEAGSIAVQAGEVILLEPAAVVFRVRGETGERFRFTYRMTER